MRHHFLAAWLWASLASAAEPQQQSCQFTNKQDQSSSLIQSTSAKQKIAFRGEELPEQPVPGEALVLPSAMRHLKDLAAKSLRRAKTVQAWMSNVTGLVQLQGRRLVREPSSPVWIILLVISGITCLCALCATLDPFGYNKSKPATVVAEPSAPADHFSVRVPRLNIPMQSRPATSVEPPPVPDTQVLCPGLVVPNGCECTLLVPRLEGVRGQVSVDDIKGVPVLRASFNNRRGSTKVLVLTSSTQEATMFAYCLRGRVERELEIHDSAGRPFGSLRMGHHSDEDASFEVSTLGGSQVRLWLKNDNELSATDTRLGQAMATATAAVDRPSCRKVRIGPLVDAGLLTVAVLASDLLTPSAEAAVAEYLSPRVRHMDGQPSATHLNMNM